MGHILDDQTTKPINMAVDSKPIPATYFVNENSTVYSILPDLAQWLDIRLWTKWLWVRVLLPNSNIATVSSNEFLDIQAIRM